MLSFYETSVSHSFLFGQSILALNDESNSFNLRGIKIAEEHEMTEEEKVGQRIANARKSAGLTQKELADSMGVSRPAVGQWEKGRTSPSAENLRSVARHTNRPLVYFFMGDEFDSGELGPPPQMQQSMAPEISWVQAGAFMEVAHVELDPDAVNWYPMPPGAGDRTFVLRVVGESMMPEYPPGRLIYVDPDRCPGSGDDVIASLVETGEATFKRFLEEPGSGKMLKALNPSWHQPYISINGNCQIIGVVVADLRLR